LFRKISDWISPASALEYPKPDDLTQKKWDAYTKGEQSDYWIYKHSGDQLEADRMFRGGEFTQEEYAACLAKLKQEKDEWWRMVHGPTAQEKYDAGVAEGMTTGATQSVGLSEKEQEKYRSADEKLRQSDWFQLSKQEQADWDRGVDYETQKADEEAEKETEKVRKVRADAEMPYLMIIAILVFVVAPFYYFPDPGFVLGWVCIIGLLGTLIWIYNRTM